MPVIAAVSKVDGVATEPGAVCVQPDYPKLAAAAKSGTPPTSGTACVAGSRCRSSRSTAARSSTRRWPTRSTRPQAYATVSRLREAVHGVAGADARVGGASAATLDVQNASVHDRNLIIPIVLLVIFLVLALLLRASWRRCCSS